MPDVPFPKEPEQTDEVFADKLVALRNRLDDAARVALTGDTTSRVRRKLLFTVAQVGIIVAIALDGIVGLLAGTLGLVAVLFLAMTDDVTVPLE